MKKFIIVLSLAAMLIICGCNKTGSVNLDERKTDRPFASLSYYLNVNESLMGEFVADTYINKRFGFKVTVPEGWYIPSQDELEAFIGSAADVKDNELAPESEITLMYCTKLDPERAVSTNSNINIILSRKKAITRTLNDEEYYNRMITDVGDVIEQSYPGSTEKHSGDFNIEINGRNYGSFSYEVDYQGTKVYLDQYFTLLGDYSLLITLTYFDADDKPIMDAFMLNIEYS